MRDKDSRRRVFYAIYLKFCEAGRDGVGLEQLGFVEQLDSALGIIFVVPITGVYNIHEQDSQELDVYSVFISLLNNGQSLP